MKRILPIALICGFLGILVGVCLGIWLNPHAPITAENLPKPTLPTAARGPQSSNLLPQRLPNQTSVALFSGIPDEQIMEKMGSADFSQAWRESESTPKYQRRWNRVMMMSKWAEKDPQAALQFLQQNVKNSDDLDSIAAVYAIFAQKDVNAAIQSLNQWSNPQHMLSAKGSILEVMSETDPFGAMKLWADVEPQGNVYGITYAAYKQDPERFMAEIQQMPRNTRLQAKDSLVATMAMENPTAAMTLAMDESSNEARQRMINAILRRVGEQDIDQAAALYDTLPKGTQGIYAMQQLVGRWAKNDPDAALAYAISIDDNTRSNYRAALNSIAMSNPQLAWEYASQEGDSTYGENTRNGVFYQILNQDIELAAKLLNEMPENERNNNLVNQYINQLAMDDPQKALDYAFSVGDPEVEKQTIQNVINILTRDDPALALTFAMENQDVADSNTMTYPFQQWMAIDEEQSLKWLRSLPDEALRKELGGQAIQRLAYQNPEQAERMLSEIEVGDAQRRSITSGIAMSYLNSSPEKAIEFSMKQSPDVQLVCLQSVFQQWNHLNKAKAAAALAALNIDAAMREQLIKNIN